MKTQILSLILWLALGLLCARAQNVLFVGNSFTHGPQGYGKGTVTDLHNKDVGGIPAIFKKLAEEGGKNPQVSHELSGGKTLEWHYQNHADAINQPWDIVVLQEYSTRPLITEDASGKNREAFRTYVEKLSQLVREQNPEVRIYLYETWARPDRVLKGIHKNLDAMQDDLREGYSQAAADYKLAGWAPVGDSFVEAVKRGISDDPSTTEVIEGPIDVWGKDRYHQSNYGAYLSALTFYTLIYNADPRELPTGEGSAAAGLKLDPEQAKALQTLAYDMGQK